MSERVVLHSDLNNCYASIECMLNPELRGKYIAVCGSTEDRHGIVLAKNNLAKQYGVKTGDVIWEAKQKCPMLTVVHPHMDQYLKYSAIVRDIYKRYSPDIEPYGIDESWIELTGSQRLKSASPEDIANEIRNTVREETGLTVSIGVSFNKIFAKLGSDMKKPDAVTVITKDSFRQQVWPLPASDLLFVGRSTTAKLHHYGINTIGQLAQTQPELLHRILGKNGDVLHSFANGLDNSRVMPDGYSAPIKSVGHGITCTRDLVSEIEVHRVLSELSQSIGLKLKKHNLAATGVRIGVRDNKLQHRQYQAKLPFPTQSFTEIAMTAYDIFTKKHVWTDDIRSLTVAAIDLISGDCPIQTDIWMNYEKHDKRMALEATVEDIRRRYGLNSINFASLGSSLGVPDSRETEFKMPSAMYR